MIKQAIAVVALGMTMVAVPAQAFAPAASLVDIASKSCPSFTNCGPPKICPVPLPGRKCDPEH